MGLRIISGNLRGKKIFTLPGRQIRPTADRLRESIFDILGPAVCDATVLDLFAGTGALGIEALSRGARFAAFVDVNLKAMDLIKKNIHSCSLDAKSRAILWDILKNLNCLTKMPEVYDLVFLDPPYGKSYLPLTLHHLARSEKLVKNARIVMEHAIVDPVSIDMPGYRIVDQRKYGTTSITFLNYDLSHQVERTSDG